MTVRSIVTTGSLLSDPPGTVLGVVFDGLVQGALR